MQLKYNRQQSLGRSLIKTFIKVLIIIVFLIISFFLIEKITFPSPEKKYEIDITNDIKKL